MGTTNESGRHLIYAIEGLDGTGKTTTAQTLAERLDAIYHHYMDGNPLAPLRERINQPTTPTETKFRYYVACAVDSYQHAERHVSESDIFLDRTIASTIAYFYNSGINSMLSQIPQSLLDQIDTMIYFTASEDTRMERMVRRTTDGHLQQRDEESIMIARAVDQTYRMIMPAKTLVVSTENKSPQDVVDEVEDRLDRRRRGLIVVASLPVSLANKRDNSTGENESNTDDTSTAIILLQTS